MGATFSTVCTLGHSWWDESVQVAGAVEGLDGQTQTTWTMINCVLPHFVARWKKNAHTPSKYYHPLISSFLHCGKKYFMSSNMKTSMQPFNYDAWSLRRVSLTSAIVMQTWIPSVCTVYRVPLIVIDRGCNCDAYMTRDYAITYSLCGFRRRSLRRRFEPGASIKRRSDLNFFTPENH